MDFGSDFLYGLGFSAFLALTAYLALKWASTKTQQVFTGVLLGGIVFRLFVVGIVLIWVWKFTDINGGAFTTALLGSYLVFQFAETIIIQRQIKRMKTVKRA